MKTFTKISLASLFLTSVSAFANGAGYNGPDLHPISIPVQLDRGISVAEIGQAIQICLATGDAARGLQSVMEKAQRQVDPSSSISPDGWSKPEFQAYEWKDENHQRPNVRIIEGTARFHVTNAKDAYAESGYAETIFRPGDEHSSLNFVVATDSGVQVFLTTAADEFPYVSYSAILQDGGYDELGRHQDGKTIVNGLSIVVPADFQANGSAVPTYNPSTQQKTAVTLNSKEYVQCLVSQIQK